MLILFLGRSLEGILADARKHFPEETEVLVVTRDGDQLQPPEGLAHVTAGRFQPTDGAEYKVVANGGTASQLVPVLKKLAEAAEEGDVSLQVFDLQREGVARLW